MERQSAARTGGASVAASSANRAAILDRGEDRASGLCPDGRSNGCVHTWFVPNMMSVCKFEPIRVCDARELNRGVVPEWERADSHFPQAARSGAPGSVPLRKSFYLKDLTAEASSSFTSKTV